jgi:hypothetical protein
MSKRRTAEEALSIPTAVQDFIERGVLLKDTTASADTGNAAADVQSDKNQTDPKVIDLGSERQPPLISRKRSSQTKPTPDLPSTSLDNLSRTYAKATVQKTIRFHPKLIAELEAHTRKQELDGEKPIPFQQVQNEALDLWLERHVR